jgi:CheY-like chemotaxis protein
MDVEMPIMDGLTAARKIREWERRSSFITNDIDGSLKPRPRLSRGRSSTNSSTWSFNNTEDDNMGCSRLPIIAISANARPEQTNDAIVAGMDDTIAKPFRIADLIPRIDHLLRKQSCSVRTWFFLCFLFDILYKIFTSTLFNYYSIWLNTLVIMRIS